MEGSKLIDLSDVTSYSKNLLEENDVDTRYFSLDLLTDFVKLFRRLRMWVLTATMSYVRSYQSIRLIDYDSDDNLIDVTSDGESAAAESTLANRYLDIINMANELWMMSKSLTDHIYNAFVEEAQIDEYYLLISGIGLKLYGQDDQYVLNWRTNHTWEVRNA